MYTQLAFEQILYSPMERRLVLEQILYKKPITIVNRFFEYFMQLRPQSPIRITPNYPIGWYADVVSEDKVWTIECYRGEIRLIKVADLCGYTSNGRFITNCEEDISDNDVYEYYQQCHFAGGPDDPILCLDFCNYDDDHSNCECCPWKRSLSVGRSWTYKYS